MELITVLVSAATAILLGLGRIAADRAPLKRLSNLVSIKKELEDASPAQTSLDEAIDRCSAKVAQNERLRYSGFRMALGMVLAAAGIGIMLMAASLHDPISDPLLSVEFGWAVGGWLIMVGGIITAQYGAKTSTRTTVRLGALRDAEFLDIDERYSHRQTYRRSQSKRNLNYERLDRQVQIRKRAKTVKRLS